MLKQHFDRRDLQRLTGSRALERGARFLREGLVHNLRLEEKPRDIWALSGEVFETPAARPRRATLSNQGSYRIGFCSCPDKVNCAHVAALGLAHLLQQEHPEPEAPTLPHWRVRLGAWTGGGAPRATTERPLAYRLELQPDRRPERSRLQVQLGRITPEGFSPLSWFQLTSTEPAHRLMAAELQQLRAQSYRWGIRDHVFYTDAPLLIPDELVDPWLRSLALVPCLVGPEGEPIRVRPDAPLRPTLHFERAEDGSAVLTPCIAGPEGEIDPSTLTQLAGQPAWGFANGAFHPLVGDLPTSSAAPIRVEAEEVPAFEETFLPRLAVAGRLTGPAAPQDVTVRRTPPRAQLLLTEHKGKLIGRVGYLYDGLRVETSHPHDLIGPPDGPWTQRDQAREKELRAVLKEWVPRAHGGKFSLGGDEALDFLTDTLDAMLESGWEALGEDALSLYRLSKSAATSRYTVTSGLDWFEVEAALEVDGETTSWPELVEALYEKRRYVRLGSGRYAALPKEWLKAQTPILAALGLDLARLGGKVRLPRHQAPLIDRLLEGADEVQADESWRDFIGKLKTFGGIDETPIPEGFEGELRPYQHQGLNYLTFLSDYGLHGILADDMGLGKTVQTAAHLVSRRAAGAGPSLVVAPTSVIANWQSELSRFAPGLRVLVLHGAEREREAIEAHDVVLTTYATARLDLEAHRAVTYDTLILDEAQAIKNPASQTAAAVRSLQARHRLCLTGTPIENNLMELWSQFAFLMPGMLGDERTFRGRYAQPIANGDAKARVELKERVAPFILRRLKSEVATDLPPRSDFVVWCDMEPAQRMAYQAVLAASRERVLAAVGEKGIAQSQITILDALLKLRQVCCHPRLLKTAQTMHLPSAKLEAFMELVEELVEGGHRALVFSQFTSMLAILKEKLDEAGVAYEYLDGRTRDRQAKVDRFNRGDTPLFLISLKAGGTGLNLTGADYVIHFDPWWNPAVEDQATDRAHRIGQTRQVFNYKLIARGTVEEKLLTLQERKRGLVRDILESDAVGKQLTLDDLRFLFEAPAL